MMEHVTNVVKAFASGFQIEFFCSLSYKDVFSGNSVFPSSENCLEPDDPYEISEGCEFILC